MQENNDGHFFLKDVKIADLSFANYNQHLFQLHEPTYSHAEAF